MISRAAFGAGLLAAVLISAGAGGSQAGERVPADDWAESICTSLERWSTDLAEAQAEVDPDDPDLRARKRSLVRYLEEVTVLTRDLVRDFKRAGVPDVRDGKPIAKAFRKGANETRKAFASAADDASSLRVRNPDAFERGQRDLYDEIQAAREDAAAPFVEADEKYDARELEGAFRATPACTRSG
jgi:hypothetical protein